MVDPENVENKIYVLDWRSQVDEKFVHQKACFKIDVMLILKLAYCREVSSANKSQIAFLVESGRPFIYKEK